MGTPIVLVAFASQSGSTAGIAQVIDTELRAAGLDTECRAASDVTSLAAYAAVVLGSGVFVRSRASDGGGFLARHRTALQAMPVWLFSAGPIGRGHPDEAHAAGECPVMDVAAAIGARGAAAFGSLGMPEGEDGVDRLAPVDGTRVRAWAREIAAGVAPGRGVYAAAS